MLNLSQVWLPYYSFAGHFAMPIDTTSHELAVWGIDLRQLIKTRNFVFSEVGLGGADPSNQ